MTYSTGHTVALGPVKRRSRLGGAPRIPTVTARSGGRRLWVWKRDGSILETF